MRNDEVVGDPQDRPYNSSVAGLLFWLSQVLTCEWVHFRTLCNIRLASHADERRDVYRYNPLASPNKRFSSASSFRPSPPFIKNSRMGAPA